MAYCVDRKSQENHPHAPQSSNWITHPIDNFSLGKQKTQLVYFIWHDSHDMHLLNRQRTSVFSARPCSSSESLRSPMSPRSCSNDDNQSSLLPSAWRFDIKFNDINMSGTSQSPENLNYSVSAKWWHVSQSLAWLQECFGTISQMELPEHKTTWNDCDNIASSTTVRSCNFCPSQYHM